MTVLAVGSGLAAPSAVAAVTDRTFVEVTSPTTYGGTETVGVVLLDDTNRPFPATVEVTVAPAGQRPHRAVAHRMGRNGRTSVLLPASFDGKVTAVYKGDGSHRAARQTERITPPAKPTTVFVLPTSATFGQVLGCTRIHDDTDYDVTYTVVLHGGRYTDLGNYDDPQLDTLVPDGDHTVTIQTNDGSITFGGLGPLPAAPFTTTFTPTYDENLAPYTGDLLTKSGETVPETGTLPDEAATC